MIFVPSFLPQLESFPNPVVKLLPKEEVKAPVSASPVVEEATSALQALGYSEKEVARVMKKMKDETFTDVQACISQALRLMVER